MRARWTAPCLLLLALLSQTGISGGDAHPPAAQAPTAESNGSTTVATASALFSRGELAIVTGWEQTPERLHSAACGSCHSRAHSDWRGSGHAAAWSDEHFQRAYALEPRRWCRNCHAPLAAQEAGSVPRAEGVGCAACHVRDGAILGARALPGTPGGHAVARAQGFSEPDFCGGCHQFPFPRHLRDSAAGAVEYSTEPMQDTLAEWRAASASTCVTCHAGGHRYTGPRDEQWLARVFGEPSVSHTEPDVISVRVPLAPRGHAMPTGDLYRSFVFELAETPGFERVLGRRRYGREFDGRLEPSSFIAHGQSRDTRVPAGATSLNMTVDAPRGGWLYARVRYYRNDAWTQQGWTPDPSSASVVWERQLPVAEGALQP
jgi:hypothetical protein